MTQPINTDDGSTKPSLTSPRGRPRTTSVKDHWISFRVTAEEHFALLDKAERSGMSAGEYARSRVLRGIARARLIPILEAHETEIDLKRLMAAEAILISNSLSLTALASLNERPLAPVSTLPLADRLYRD